MSRTHAHGVDCLAPDANARWNALELRRFGTAAVASERQRMRTAAISLQKATRLEEARHQALARYGHCESCGQALARCAECGAFADSTDCVCPPAAWEECRTGSVLVSPASFWNPAEYEQVCERCWGNPDDDRRREDD